MRLLVIDSCEFTRLGLRHVFGQFPHVEIMEACNVKQALDVMPKVMPAACVANIDAEDVSLLLQAQPRVNVVVFSARSSDALKSRALGLGAFAFVSKGDDLAVLVESIRSVATATGGDTPDATTLTEREA